jgi:hypothetical protein
VATAGPPAATPLERLRPDQQSVDLGAARAYRDLPDIGLAVGDREHVARRLPTALPLLTWQR